MMRAGSGRDLQRGVAVRRFEDLIALGAQAHSQQFADRRLVVDDQDFDRRGAQRPVQRAAPPGSAVGWEDGPRRRAVGGRIVPCMASTKPREIASPSPVPARTGRPFARDGTCRRSSSRSAGGMPCLVDDLQRTTSDRAQPLDRNRGARRRVFGGVVEKIEQHLLEQYGIELEHRQIGGRARTPTG